MVKIRKNIVSKSIANSVTYNGTNAKTYIVIHETANTNKGANAETHGRLQANGFSASWHYTVDDKEAVQSFSDSTQCWHAGNSTYNRNGIGIEICVNSDGNYKKAVANAAELVKLIMEKYSIPIKNVVQHNTASGKDCPHFMRAGSKGVTWAQFKAMLAGSASAVEDKPDAPSKPNGKSIAAMANEIIAGKHGSGHANRQKSLGISKSEYEKVRAEVNKRAGSTSKAPAKKSTNQMASEVLAGKHGNGRATRRKSLGINKTEYNKVKIEVNKRLMGKSKTDKTVSQMATEVIQGKHGTGHANRRKSLDISQAEYNKVRAEVNKRL